MNTQSHTITGLRARIYDRLMSVLGSNRVQQKALALVMLHPGERLLDIGCGTGAFLKMARTQFPKAEFFGIDASEDMLAQARAKFKTAIPSVIFTCADASILPFPNESVDFAVSILAFHHMPDGTKIRAVQEISRVLKKGGKCLVVDFGRAFTAWGRMQTFFLNRHSYTKGNMEFLEREMARWGLQKERQEWHRGCVEYLLARRES